LSLLCPFPLSSSLLGPGTTQRQPWMCPEGSQIELERERCVPKVLKLSSEVSECKALGGGDVRRADPVCGVHVRTAVHPLHHPRVRGQAQCPLSVFSLVHPYGNLSRLFTVMWSPDETEPSLFALLFAISQSDRKSVMKRNEMKRKRKRNRNRNRCALL